MPGWSWTATFRADARLNVVTKDAPSRAIPNADSSVPLKTGSPVLFSKSAMRMDCAFGATAGAAAGRLFVSQTTPPAAIPATTTAAAAMSTHRFWSSSKRTFVENVPVARSARTSSTLG